MEISEILRLGYQGFLETDTFLYHRKNLNWRRDLLKSFIRPFAHLILSLRRSSILKEKNLGLVLTRNQSKFVSPIIECLNDNRLVSLELECERHLSIGNLKGLYRFNLKWFLIGWSVLKGLDVLDKIHLLSYYHGYYLGAKKFFQRSQVCRLIVSNEVHPCLRFVVLAARSSGVETVLIPHTLPSEKFPSIIHDIVFFRGKSSIAKYRVSEYSKVYVVGDPTPFKEVDRVNSCIGIAVNALDDLEAVVHLISKISDAQRCIAIKLHPVFTEVPAELLDFEDMIKADIYDFFKEIKCLITGNSAIVVDALKQGIPVFLYEGVCDDIFCFSEYNIAPNLTAELMGKILKEDETYRIEETDFNSLLCDFGASSQAKILEILS